MADAVAARQNWMQSAELLSLLVLKDLRVRYKSSVLGYIWAVANPLANAAVYYVAFHVIIRVQMDNYTSYLLTGLFPWTWASASLTQAAGAYRANESLVRKVQLRRGVLPLSVVLQEMLHFFFACPILLAIVVMGAGRFHLSWLVLVPLMALVQAALIYPIGVLLAALNVIVRDIEYLTTIALQLLFFLTPIVYAESAIPAEYRAMFELNPFLPMVVAWREVFYAGTLNVAAVARVLMFAAVFGAIAWQVHRSIEPRIGELL